MSLKQWNILHVLTIIPGLVIFHVTGLFWPVVILSFLSLILLWTSQWYTISHLKPAGGYGNLLTLFRYLVVILIVAMSGLWSTRITGLLFIIPVVLDGLDGYMARKKDQVSKFGALFDMETDALFVALAGSLLFSRHITGAWFLPAAYLRYIYLLVLTLLRLNRIPEKRTRFGTAVAVFMFISLIAGYIYPSVFSGILLSASAVLVVISFVYSFISVFSQRQLY